MGPIDFIESFIQEDIEILNALPRDAINEVIDGLASVRGNNGRLFVLGVGGSAASASHLVNDLRKIVQLEAYTPTDNVSELTARINDEGWESSFVEWLRGSHLKQEDALFILSVGGGDLERNISPNLVRSIQYAKELGARVFGIVGRKEGYTARVADACVVIPEVNAEHVTPHTESFHSVVGHLIVSHPKLKVAQTKWESATADSRR